MGSTQSCHGSRPQALGVYPASETSSALTRDPTLCPPEVQLSQFQEPGIFNYSALLLSEDKDILYVGAREAVFALNALNISEKQHEVRRSSLLPYVYMLAPRLAGLLWPHGLPTPMPAPHVLHVWEKITC